MKKWLKILLACLGAVAFLLGSAYALSKMTEHYAHVMRRGLENTLREYRSDLWWDRMYTGKWFHLKGRITEIDPKSKRVTLKLWFEFDGTYDPQEYDAWLFYNGVRHDAVWDDEMKMLAVEPFRRPAGEQVEECRIVVERASGGYIYQQLFLEDGSCWRIDDIICTMQQPRDVFSGEGTPKADSNAFHWRTIYMVKRYNMPFDSKLESARVYAADKETGKELFSQDLQDGKTSVNRSFKLTSGKSDMLLFGEVTCEDGMRYRYYLGQVQENYYYDRYGENEGPYFYFDRGSPPDDYFLHALFPDGTMIGLCTNTY